MLLKLELVVIGQKKKKKQDLILWNQLLIILDIHIRSDSLLKNIMNLHYYLML